MSKIEKALLEVTGQKPQKKGEDRQKYLLRLADHANNKLKDDEWELLGAEAGAQDWVTAAIKADNDEKELPDFPDVEKEEAAADDASEGSAGEDDERDLLETAGDEPEEGEEEDVKPKKSTAKVGAAKKPEPKKPEAKKPAPAAKKPEPKKPEPKKPEAKKSGGAKTPSMRRTMKMIIVKRPKITVEDLIEALEKKGHKSPSKLTVSSIRADTRDTMKVLVEAGLLDVEM